MSDSTAKKTWSRPAKYQCSARRAHDADAAGERLVGLARARQRGVGVAADEDDDGPGAVCPVARVGEAPAAEEGVVGEELVAVVGGPAGEVELDEQVEGELSASMRSSSDRSGLISVNGLGDVDDRLAVGDGDLVEGDRVAALAGADLRDGVAAGGIARRAPVVGGQRRRRCGGARSPSRARAGRGAAGRRGAARSAAIRAAGRSPGGLAGLGDLEAVAGERVQQRRLAVAARVLADADGVRGRSGRAR